MKTITVHSATRRARTRGVTADAFLPAPASADTARQQTHQSAETIKDVALNRVLIVISPFKLVCPRCLKDHTFAMSSNFARRVPLGW
jgi:hypothetical protein